MTRDSDWIRIRGARQHNLQNIDLDLPRNRLVVVTGVSGSGKSSLVFDTLYAEGQRRYLESLAGGDRLLRPRSEAPDLDGIEGLSPAIAIEPKTQLRNPRSTVATLTEVLDLLRPLFVHCGTVHCPKCGRPVTAHSIARMVRIVADLPEASRLLILAPLGNFAAGKLPERFERLRRDGFARVRIEGRVYDLDPPPRPPRRPRYPVEVVVDRLVLRRDQLRRLGESVELALKTADGLVRVAPIGGEELTFSNRLACLECRLDLTAPVPELFSFVHPLGACPECQGLGTLASPASGFAPDSDQTPATRSRPCPACNGSRFSAAARRVRLHGLTIDAACALIPSQLESWLHGLPVPEGLDTLVARSRQAILQRTALLRRLGLGYLALDRSAPSLSGGETQRVRLVRQLCSPLSGVLYALDEPSIGLHAADHRRLLEVLQELRDRGNTVIVVEHDSATLRAADFVVDLGPGAGPLGGRLLFAGHPRELETRTDSETALYLSGRKRLHTAPSAPASSSAIFLEGACGRNLHDLSVRFPLGCITCVTGVSGAGKSTLVMDTLYPAIHSLLHHGHRRPLPYRSLTGLKAIDQVVALDQSPIGRTLKSIPATYLGLFRWIRELFAGLPEARARGYTARRFSFNIAGGRCEECKGEGALRLETTMLPELTVRCPACGGSRYRAEILDIRFKGRSIAEILQMSVAEALELFENLPLLRDRLQLLQEVGLGYLRLGQGAPSLSCGEAQRLRLARELGRGGGGRVLYLLDQPTTGLHSADIQLLLDLLRRLVDAGHSVILIEHHLDLIRAVDHVIDLGPGAGPAGGRLVACGSPAEIAAHADSVTGRALRQGLG